MSKIDTLKRLWREDRRQVLSAAFDDLARTGVTNCLPDETYLKLIYRVRFGEKLDLADPQTFSQKMQWLKLHDRQERYTALVDKVLVKEHVAEVIGPQYIIPTLGVWDTFDAIDFGRLPDRFVLKCNHDSGSVVLCAGKERFDREAARKKLTKRLRTDGYSVLREWPYRNVKRKILAEAYLGGDAAGLPDYKLMVFNGEVRCTFVTSERFSEGGLRVTVFDRDWQVMPFGRRHPRSTAKIDRPARYDEMVRFAEKLAEDIPFVRVDFYETGGRLYFGEMTLYPAGGLEEFVPAEWDRILGGWLRLPGGARGEGGRAG